jgi:hydroxymethylglutaryl-CoA lyase
MFTKNFIPKLKKYIHIIEVSPRDGLQNEKFILNIEQRKILIEKCTNIGLNHIEIGSFVNPKLVPQMANTDELLNSLNNKNISKYETENKYSVLVPNLKMFKKHKNINEIVLFVAASETFNQKNINCDSKTAFKRFEPIFKLAKEENIPIRGSISTCFNCPYEGKIDYTKVLRIVNMYLENGAEYVDIADTIGTANVEEVDILFNILNKFFPIHKITAHFHDTYDKAIDNVEAALSNGITTFHSSLGGLGGCPFSPKRSGNLSTERLVEYLEKHSDKYTISTTLEQCKEVGNYIHSIKSKFNK